MNRINIIGDSHSLAFDNNNFEVTHLGGVLAYNLHKRLSEIVNNLFHNNISKETDWVFFSLGEIDIRCHLGFRAQEYNKSYSEIVDECISNYLILLTEIKKLGYNVGVWGPIATGPDEGAQGNTSLPSFGPRIERDKITRIFNDKLKEVCLNEDITFKTLYYDIMSSAINNNSYFDWFSCDGVHINAGIFKGTSIEQRVTGRREVFKRMTPSPIDIDKIILSKFTNEKFN